MLMESARAELTPQQLAIIAAFLASCADRFFLSNGVVGVDVVVENFDELGDNLVPLQCREEATIDVDGSLGFFGGARKRYSQARVLRFAGAIDYAAHHRDFHFFHASVANLPDWHLLAQISLNLLRHFLEEGAG